VLASHTDQWGLVVNEAMAAGVPVLVSSACGCHADLITEGVTGWGFDPADPAALCAAIHRLERLSAGERAAVVAAARQRLEAFSPEAFAAGLERALERAMEPVLTGTRPRPSRRACLSAALLSRR
jgi:glycosyltransferase involved in cell wall biosynthesis